MSLLNITTTIYNTTKKLYLNGGARTAPPNPPGPNPNPNQLTLTLTALRADAVKVVT